MPIYSDDMYRLALTREYVGPYVFTDGKLEYSAFAGGYFDPDKGAMYYVTDWQGNNVAVVSNTGLVAQRTIYYPYGEPTIEPSGQRYLFGGKEREHAGDRNFYDFGARCLTPYGRWGVPDSEAESFYPYSPYTYCVGDPINYIDPDGRQVLVMPSPILGVSNPLLLSSSKPIVRPIAEAVTNEGHHIIPRALKTRPIVEEAIKQGYKFEGKENITSVEKFSKAANTGRHGNHPKYTARVAKKIEASNPSEGSGAIDIIRGVASEALKAIQDNPGVKINDLEFETMMPSLDVLKLFLERFQDGGCNQYTPWIQNNDSENEVSDFPELYLIYCR